jgi:hypothetical protein
MNFHVLRTNHRGSKKNGVGNLFCLLGVMQRRQSSFRGTQQLFPAHDCRPPAREGFLRTRSVRLYVTSRQLGLLG